MPRKRFTAELHQQVIERIAGVPAGERVTWDRVRAFAAELGVTVSRQRLNRIKAIVEAYHGRSGAGDGGGKRNASQAEIRKLRDEVRLLRDMIADRDHSLLRILHNAREHNIGLEQLNREIPNFPESPSRAG